MECNQSHGHLCGRALKEKQKPNTKQAKVQINRKDTKRSERMSANNTFIWLRLLQEDKKPLSGNTKNNLATLQMLKVNRKVWDIVVYNHMFNMLIFTDYLGLLSLCGDWSGANIFLISHVHLLKSSCTCEGSSVRHSSLGYMLGDWHKEVSLE